MDDWDKGQRRNGDGEGRAGDRLTSPNLARRAEAERPRREVETDTLQALDEILSEVTEQYVEPRIRTGGRDGHIRNVTVLGPIFMTSRGWT